MAHIEATEARKLFSRFASLASVRDKLERAEARLGTRFTRDTFDDDDLVVIFAEEVFPSICKARGRSLEG